MTDMEGISVPISDETNLAGPCTEESLEDVLLRAAALIATTSERAIRRTDQVGDRIVVRRSELLALAKVVETAAPTLVQRLRDRLPGDTRPNTGEIIGGPVNDERVTGLAVEYVNAETEPAKKAVYAEIEAAAGGDPSVMDRTHLAIKTEVRRRKGDPTECPLCSSQDILAFKAVWRCYGCNHEWTVNAPNPAGDS